MTINSISSIASTPFTGLGTQTFNVLTTGIYTTAFNITIPWTTSDQAYARANPEAAQIQSITLEADSAGSLNSTYWTFGTAGDAYSYYVWYNINSAGVDPAPTGYTAGIAVLGATNATAGTLATATYTAIAASAAATYVIATNPSSGVVTLTNRQYGTATAAADGTADPGFAYAVGTTGTYGYASGLVVKVKKNSTIVLQQDNPTPTQPLMAGSTTIAATAGDTITVVTSSLASADNVPNAVKGIINVYAGQ